MNLDELRTVQNKERSKDSLQHLRDSFYQEVAGYVQELRDEREAIAAEVENPWNSEDIARLSDEIETAEEVVEAIYERRVGKVVKRASLAAAGMPADDEGLTDEEQVLFADLVERIQSNKARVLDVLAGDIPDVDTGTGPATDAGSTSSEPASGAGSGPTDAVRADGASAAAAMGESGDVDAGDSDADPGTERAEDGDVDAGSDVERTTVRITRDVGEIFGVDEREYVLSSEDVVTLPSENADPLVERDAAELLE